MLSGQKPNNLGDLRLVNYQTTKNMKHLKLMVLLVVTMLTFTFASAEAQVSIRIGTGHYVHNGRHYHHRRPYMRNHHRYYRYY